MRILLLAAVALLAAGCVTPPLADNDPGADAEALPFPDPLGQDHDHSDPALHTNAWNFEQTSHHPLAGTSTHTAGAHALDLRAGWLFAAIYGGEADAEGGFFVFNVSDPEQPKEVGRYRFAGPLGGDRSMEANEDATFVVLGTEAIDCAGHVNPFGPGLYLIDVRDKANPTVADYIPMQMVHSITIHRIDGEDYVFGLMSADENIYRIDKDGLKPELTPIGAVNIGHDSVVHDDPIDIGKTYLYSASDSGFEIWDVSDPAKPEKLAVWDIPNRPKDMYYIHTGVVQFIEGRRILVVTTEDWEDYPSRAFILDATKFDYIETLTNWTAPGEHAAEELRYSMHNPRFHGNVLLVSYYHGGVWAVDLATPESPRVVGQFMPHEDTGFQAEAPKTSAGAEAICPKLRFADVPFVFDVESGDGVVYVADLHTGMYTIKPTW